MDNFTSVRMNYNVNKREGAEKSVDDLRKRFIDVEHYALAEGETIEKLQNDEPEKAVDTSKETYLQAIAENTPRDFLLHHSLMGGCLSFTELSNYAKVDVIRMENKTWTELSAADS